MQSRPISVPSTCGTHAADAGDPEAPGEPPAAPTPSAGAGPIARASSSDGVDVEVALMKGPVNDLVDVELFSASARRTADQLTVQGAVSRIELHTRERTVALSSEKLSFKVNSSRINPDGSVGGNAAIGATLIGAELTLRLPGRGGSITGGLSVGVGAELGLGTRDLDKDGRTELCGRVSFLVATAGLCLENPF